MKFQRIRNIADLEIKSLNSEQITPGSALKKMWFVCVLSSDSVRARAQKILIFSTSFQCLQNSAKLSKLAFQTMYFSTFRCFQGT